MLLWMAMSILIGETFLDGLVQLMGKLCSFFLQSILLHVCKAAAFQKMHPLLIATAFKGYTLIAIAVCVFHPCHLHLSHFPVCSICSEVDNVLVSFLQGWCEELVEKKRIFFSPKSEGLYTSEKETWNNELILRYIFAEAKSLCMLTVVTHDTYIWLPVKMTAKIVEFMLPHDKQVHTL